MELFAVLRSAWLFADSGIVINICASAEHTKYLQDFDEMKETQNNSNLRKDIHGGYLCAVRMVAVESWLYACKRLHIDWYLSLKN